MEGKPSFMFAPKAPRAAANPAAANPAAANPARIRARQRPRSPRLPTSAPRTETQVLLNPTFVVHLLCSLDYPAQNIRRRSARNRGSSLTNINSIEYMKHLMLVNTKLLAVAHATLSKSPRVLPGAGGLQLAVRCKALNLFPSARLPHLAAQLNADAGRSGALCTPVACSAKQQ